MNHPRSLTAVTQRVISRVFGREREHRPPLVSVVVPVYNVEDYLAECLDSVLSQEYDALEVIVVNDGATDSSPAIAAEYAAKDPRVTIIDQPNGGLGSARNTGVAAATGDYLTFVDSDDTIPLNAYRVMVETLEESGSDVAVGRMVRTRGLKDDEILLDWAESLHSADRIGIEVTDFPRIVRDFYSPNKMYRTPFWRRHGFRFREGVLFEDQPLITQIYCRARTIDVLRTITYRWRNREDDTSLSSALHALEPVLARQEAIKLTRAALADEPASIVAAWRWSLVDHYLPNYLRGCAAIGEAELDAAIEMSRLVVSADDLLDMDDCRPQSRVICYAALAHGPAAVRCFLKQRGRQVSEFPVEWVDGTPLVRLPLFHDDEFSVPDALFALSDEQLSLQSWFSGAHWDGTELAVRGRAYIDFVDTSMSPVTTLRLTRTDTGESHDFPTRSVPDTFVGPRPSHAYVDHSGADFEAKVPVAALASPAGRDCTWNVSVVVDVAGISRQAELTQPSHSALHGVPFGQRMHGGTVASLMLARDIPLRLRVTTPEAMLTNLEVQGDTVHLQVSGDGAIGLSVTDASSADGPAVEPPCRPGGTVDMRISDLPAVGNLSWRDRDDGTHPLRVAPDLAARARDAEVELDLPPPPRAVLRTPRKHVLVTGLSMTASHLCVDLGAVPPEVTELTLWLTSPRVDTHPCVIKVPADRGPVTARLPLAYSEWGRDHHGYLPRTDFRLRMAQANGTEVPWRLSPNVDLPTLFTTDRIACRVFRRTHGFRLRVNRPLHPDETTRVAVHRRTRHWAGHPAPLEDAVFFQCLSGDLAADSPLALHRVLRRRHPDLPLFWGVQDHTVRLPEGAIPVVRQTEEWFRALHTSRWVCVSDELPGEYTKTTGQVVLQTYHGHPFKAMGMSRWDALGMGPERIERELEKRAAWDYLLAPSPVAARLYRENFPLDVQVLEVGHPRNDALADSRADRTRREVRERLGIADGTTAILYAPTWRDHAEDNPRRSKMVDFLDPHAFGDSLGHGHTLLVRGHPANQRHRSRVGDSGAVIDVTDYPDVNDLTLASDIGVFDYSSIRFDYSVTRKPMLFFVPDEDEYLAASPGLLDYSRTTPGPRVHTEAQLRDAVLDISRVSRDHADEYDEFVATFNPWDDGHAAERCVDIVFADLASGKERP